MKPKGDPVVFKKGVKVLPPPLEAARVEKLRGFLHGSVVIPPEVDLTAPVADEAFFADRGESHQ